MYFLSALFRHDDLPGYSQLSLPDRLRVDARALARLLLSVTFLHMLAALLIWLLAGYILMWHLDMPPVRVHAPCVAAPLWWLPWLAVARRRLVREIVGSHWTEL